MSAIIGIIISFFVQALALKLALGLLGQPSAQNKYTTALGVSGGFTVASIVVGSVPFFGWLLVPVMWIAIVMGVYHIGFIKSLGVAVLQVILKMMITLILAIFGIKIGGTGFLF